MDRSQEMSALSIQSVFCLGNPDTGDQGDLTLSLHHLAGLWGPRVSRLLPQLPVQGAGNGLSERGPGARGGALQRWHRALRDLLPCGHLPSSGGYRSLLLITSYSPPGPIDPHVLHRIPYTERHFRAEGWQHGYIWCSLSRLIVHA